MKITVSELKRIINETALLNEEPADYYKDYKAGTITFQEYQALVKRYEARYGSERDYQRRRPSKTTFVGMGANGAKIKAIEDAIAIKPNNFLNSVLGQLEAGRGLSAKQNAVVRKILGRSPYNADATLFEGDAQKMTKRQLQRMIREEYATIDYDTTEEVEAKEDVWSGGENLALSLDHSKAGGSEAVTAEPEVLSITESELRKTIRMALKV